jgi:hypothetical protein
LQLLRHTAAYRIVGTLHFAEEMVTVWHADDSSGRRVTRTTPIATFALLLSNAGQRGGWDIFVQHDLAIVAVTARELRVIFAVHPSLNKASPEHAASTLLARLSKEADVARGMQSYIGWLATGDRAA